MWVGTGHVAVVVVVVLVVVLMVVNVLDESVLMERMHLPVSVLEMAQVLKAFQESSTGMK